jgi:hypothetical protein
MNPVEFSKIGNDTQILANKLSAVINNRSINSARSKQKQIGLSEVGEPCVRKTAYRILDWNKTNLQTDPWASISGTAIHSWLAEAFDKVEGYLVEHSVEAADGLKGTSDLFDIEEGMVIDHKCVGASSMKSRKRDGMTFQQRVQINLYGLGFENAGYKVNKVALAFYPLGGRLDGLYTIVEDYNRQLALNAIDRFAATQNLVWTIDPEKDQGAWDLIPKTTSYTCIYCPWYLPGSNNPAVGCSGEVGAL